VALADPEQPFDPSLPLRIRAERFCTYVPVQQAPPVMLPISKKTPPPCAGITGQQREAIYFGATT